jgi:DNA-binding transcriptional ArsR family regulator
VRLTVKSKPLKSTRPIDGVFAAIAHPARRQILERLCARSGNVNELAQPFGMSRPAVSQHLRALLDSKLIRVRKVGRERRYALSPHGLKPVYDWVAHYQVFWTQKLTNLGKHLDRTL